MCVCVGPGAPLLSCAKGHANTSMCVCVCTQDDRGHDLSVCPLHWVTKAKPRSLTHIHWRITRTAKPPPPWPQRWWWRKRGGSVSSKRAGGWTWTQHTHTLDQTAKPQLNHPAPPSQASCRLVFGGRLISWEGSSKMKINEGISTAVGRPLESFPLLAAHFPSGEKTGQKACCAAVTLIERARNKKASKCFFYPGLSGNVSQGGINEKHKRLL